MRNELYHYGQKGMKWYQHIFGTPEQRKARKTVRLQKRYNRQAIGNAVRYSMSTRSAGRYKRANQKKDRLYVLPDVFNKKAEKLDRLTRTSDRAYRQMMQRYSKATAKSDRLIRKVDQMATKYPVSSLTKDFQFMMTKRNQAEAKITKIQDLAARKGWIDR